jgi:hypothetical protein
MKRIFRVLLFTPIFISCISNDDFEPNFEKNTIFISEEYILPLLQEEIATLMRSVKSCSIESDKKYQKELEFASKIFGYYKVLETDYSNIEFEELLKYDQKINDVMLDYLVATNRQKKDKSLFNEKVAKIKLSDAKYSQLVLQLLMIKIRNSLFFISTNTCTSETDMDCKSYPIESINW